MSGSQLRSTIAAAYTAAGRPHDSKKLASKAAIVRRSKSGLFLQYRAAWCDFAPMKSDILVVHSRAFDNLGVWTRAVLSRPYAAFGGCGLRPHCTTRRRHDDTTTVLPRPTAVATRPTKFTEHTKKSLVSLFDGFRSAGGAAHRAPPGVGAADIQPGLVIFVPFVSLGVGAEGAASNVVASYRRLVVSARSATV